MGLRSKNAVTPPARNRSLPPIRYMHPYNLVYNTN